MPITEATLVGDKSTANLAAYVTTAYTPTINRLVIASVINTNGSGVGVPTYAGNGLTWVSIATQSNAATTIRATMFRTMGGTVTSGTGLITFGASQTGCASSVYEFGGVNTTGTNGSGAVVQSATGTGTGGTSLSVTLNAFGSGNGATSLWGIMVNEALTNEAGWTEIHDQGFNTPTTSQETQWRNDADTTPSVSWTTATTSVGIAIEIALAAAVEAAIDQSYVMTA